MAMMGCYMGGNKLDILLGGSPNTYRSEATQQGSLPQKCKLWIMIQLSLIVFTLIPEGNSQEVITLLLSNRYPLPLGQPSL